MGQCLDACRYASEKAVNPNAWQDWRHHPARQYYHIGRTLGRGGFSEVVSARRKDTGEPVALKVVFLGNPKLRREHIAVLRNEVDIMMRMNHPNVTPVYCVIEDNIRRQLVMEEEMCFGSVLLEELQHVDSNNDRLLAFITKQILEALQAVHAAGVVHRDLKPDNICFKFPHDQWTRLGAIPMLLDFGMALNLRKLKRPESGLLGSSGFISPETIAGAPHSPAMDMFAMGVILYMMITGHRPMSKKEANYLKYAHYEANQYPMMQVDELWLSADASVKDLVLRLLERDASKRLTATQALAHPWIQADMAMNKSVLRPVTTTEQRARELKRERLKQSVDEGLLESFLHAVLASAKASQSRKPKAPGPRPPHWKEVSAAVSLLGTQLSGLRPSPKLRRGASSQSSNAPSVEDRGLHELLAERRDAEACDGMMRILARHMQLVTPQQAPPLPPLPDPSRSPKYPSPRSRSASEGASPGVQKQSSSALESPWHSSESSQGSPGAEDLSADELTFPSRHRVSNIVTLIKHCAESCPASAFAETTPSPMPGQGLSSAGDAARYEELRSAFQRHSELVDRSLPETATRSKDASSTSTATRVAVKGRTTPQATSMFSASELGPTHPALLRNVMQAAKEQRHVWKVHQLLKSEGGGVDEPTRRPALALPSASNPALQDALNAISDSVVAWRAESQHNIHPVQDTHYLLQADVDSVSTKPQGSAVGEAAQGSPLSDVSSAPVILDPKAGRSGRLRAPSPRVGLQRVLSSSSSNEVYADLVVPLLQ